MGKPQPPISAPKYIREGLLKQSPETLREIAAYSEQLAAFKIAEIEAHLEENRIDDADGLPDDVDEEVWSEEAWEEAKSEVDAPAKACITTKNIDGNDYFYYQWREDDKIKSEYIAPVSPSRDR